MFRTIISWFLASIFISGWSFADADLDHARPLFDARGKSVDSIHAAKRIYSKIIANSSKPMEVRREALDKFARLAVFEGEVGRSIFNTSKKDAVKIFESCLDATEYLAPSSKKNISQSAEYTYWRAMCIGLWAANASKTKVVMRGGRVVEMRNLIAYGQQNFKSFDGYGFDRIEAGMYMRSKDLSMFGLYRPEKAISLLNEAIDGSNENFMSHILKAEALTILGNYTQALGVLQTAMPILQHKLKNGEIPSEIVAESYVFVRAMKDMSGKISQM